MKINENKGTRTLRSLVKQHGLQVTSIPEKDDLDGLLKVSLSCRGGQWTIYLSDEYKEFRQNRQLLGVYMALKELRFYSTSKDFLEWCTDLEVNPSSSILREYYMGLTTVENQVKGVIGDYASILEFIHFDIPFRDAIDSQILLSEGKNTEATNKSKTQ